MSGGDVVWALCVIDLAALFVGLTVLKRVTKIVHEVADTISLEVEKSIAEAEKNTVAGFIAAATPAMNMLATSMPTVVHDAVESVAGRLRVSGDGRIEIEAGRKDEGGAGNLRAM